VERAQADQVHLPLFGPLSQSFGFGNAGWCDWSDSRDGYTGLMGMGGSVMMWHRGEQIGFGYANNSMQPMPLNHIGWKLQQEVLACAEAARSSEAVSPRG